MKLTNRIKLSTMMFLEFFIWGAWFVTLGTFLVKELSASGTQISLAYLTQSIGAIIAPFIIGLIADRFFAAQKILQKLKTKKPKYKNRKPPGVGWRLFCFVWWFLFGYFGEAHPHQRNVFYILPYFFAASRPASTQN